MPVPVQITFRGISPSDAVEAVVRQRAARLERFCDRIQRCHVTVDMPHQHHSRGNHFAIHVDIETPQGKVTVSRDRSLDDSHKDFQSVVRDAFDALTRQLEAGASRQRGDAQAHPHHRRTARVTRLFPGSSYGFLATTEGGEEVYFHESNVVDGAFERLNLGSELSVTLSLEDDSRGARAVSVRLVRS